MSTTEPAPAETPPADPQRRQGRAPRPTPPPPGAELLRVEHVAHLLDVSVATVYREIADGRLAVRKIRDRTRIHRDDLDAYLHAARQQQRTGEVAAMPTPARISLREAGLIDDDDFGPRRRRRAAT